MLSGLCGAGACRIDPKVPKGLEPAFAEHRKASFLVQVPKKPKPEAEEEAIWLPEAPASKEACDG